MRIKAVGVQWHDGQHSLRRQGKKKGLPLAEGSGAAVVAATVWQCAARRGGCLSCLY